MFRLFGPKRVPLEVQLAELARVGLVPAAGVTVEDWASFDRPEAFAADPYRRVIEVMASELQREPYTPVCGRLWMCDFERIEDNGSYREVVERLVRLSGAAVPVADVRDCVDIDAGVAWVEFDLGGERVHWDARVDNDWLDPEILLKFDALLRERTEARLYANERDYGQCSLLTCLDSGGFRALGALSRVRFAPFGGDSS